MMSSLAKQSKSALAKYQPLQGLNVFDEMERMFDNFASDNWVKPVTSTPPHVKKIITTTFKTITPKVDVIGFDNKIVVKVMMPGIEKQDIDISMTNNTVTIKGTPSHEEIEGKGDYYYCEISKGAYMRTLVLPENVDEEKAKAKFKNGLLELTIPKMEVSHRRNIKVD